MKFVPVTFSDPSLFKEDLLKLATNIFKIKYFYEEDQLPKLSFQMMNPEDIFFLTQGYQEASDEAEIYLKTITAFFTDDAILPDDAEYFNAVIEYFTVKESDLAHHELDDEDRFWEWLKNKEYSQHFVLSEIQI